MQVSCREEPPRCSENLIGPDLLHTFEMPLRARRPADVCAWPARKSRMLHDLVYGAEREKAEVPCRRAEDRNDPPFPRRGDVHWSGVIPDDQHAAVHQGGGFEQRQGPGKICHVCVRHP